MQAAHVVSVSSSPDYSFSKRVAECIMLRAGLGVEGDAHAGARVRHRFRVRHDPTQPNLRQVHLIHAELFDELAARGFDIAPGAIGENILTRGVKLLTLPTGTVLAIGAHVILAVTGLRNPCHQLDDFTPGLLAAVLGRDERGRLVRKAGVMAVVIQGGEVRPADAIRVALPPEPYHPLQPV